MQVVRAISFDPLTQPVAQFFRTLRTGEKTVQQGAKIESGAANHNGQVSSRLDFRQRLSCQTRILAGGDVAGGIDNVEQMMRGMGALGSVWLGGADLEFAIGGDRIAVHDLAVKARRQRKKKRRLPATRRPSNQTQ